MKPRSSALSVAAACTLLMAAGLRAQTNHCATDEMRQRMIQANPELLHQEAQYELGLQEYLQAKAGLRSDADTVVYRIPVVFHVLYDPTTGNDAHNISNAQIFDQMNVLNRDYAKLNPDTNQICCGFNSRAADIRVQFELATKDPFGQCTNGIDRITTQRATLAQNYSKLHPWFRQRYLNVWVANTIGSITNFGVAGYSMFPSGVQDDQGALIDGVILLHDYVGSIGTGSYGHSRTLTHEIGHYLNLQHPWGSNNNAGEFCGDDGVDDTPITKGWLYCPVPEASKVCNPDSFENYQNYMDYSYCSYMFTKGQRDRMRAALESGISGRSTLWQESNHQYTGIAGYEQTCGPQADFYPMKFFACTGTAIQFKDNSTRATPTTWAWSFEDGNPSSSNEQNPSVSFNTPGPHSVTLTVGNDYGSNSITKNAIVYIGADYSEVGDQLQESFDSEQRFSKWPVINYENNSTRWLWDNQAGHNAPGCAKLNASQTYTLVQDGFAPNGFSDQDELVTPSLDLHYLSGINLKFWFAYAARTTEVADITESLEVWTSSNCGNLWLKRKTITGAELVTAGVKTPGYLPGASDWREVTVPLPSILATSNVRIKFVYHSGLHSNDIFVDDVNISAIVGIDELSQNGSLALMPNPANNHLSVNLDLAGSPTGTLSILDMTGRTIHSQEVVAGQKQLELDLDKMGITNGVYLVRLKHAHGQRVEQLVVQ